jgi:hypothetical protein
LEAEKLGGPGLHLLCLSGQFPQPMYVGSIEFHSVVPPGRKVASKLLRYEAMMKDHHLGRLLSPAGPAMG